MPKLNQGESRWTQVGLSFSIPFVPFLLHLVLQYASTMSNYADTVFTCLYGVCQTSIWAIYIRSVCGRAMAHVPGSERRVAVHGLTKCWSSASQILYRSSDLHKSFWQVFCLPSPALCSVYHDLHWFTQLCWLYFVGVFQWVLSCSLCLFSRQCVLKWFKHFLKRILWASLFWNQWKCGLSTCIILRWSSSKPSSSLVQLRTNRYHPIPVDKAIDSQCSQQDPESECL